MKHYQLEIAQSTITTLPKQALLLIVGFAVLCCIEYLAILNILRICHRHAIKIEWNVE